MIHKLLLLSGNDIPFKEAKVTIHQPTVNDISYIGEEAFFIGGKLLDFSKDIVNQDKLNTLTLPDEMTDFDVFMIMMKDPYFRRNPQFTYIAHVLIILFSKYNVGIGMNAITLKPIQQKKENNQEEIYYISNNNFQQFKEILRQILCFMDIGLDDIYNPQSEMAKRIAKKLKEGRDKIHQFQNKKDDDINILERYLSILSVGLAIPVTELKQLTVYQVFDMFKRYSAKREFDTYIKAKMAGATGMPESPDWVGDLREIEAQRAKQI